MLRMNQGLAEKVKRSRKKIKGMPGRAMGKHRMREAADQRAEQQVVDDESRENRQSEKPDQPPGLFFGACLPVKKVRGHLRF